MKYNITNQKGKVIQSVNGVPYGVFALRFEEGNWNIDHVPSGHRCFSILFKKRAEKIIKELEKITCQTNRKKCIKEIREYNKREWLKNAVANRLKK